MENIIIKNDDKNEIKNNSKFYLKYINNNIIINGIININNLYIVY